MPDSVIALALGLHDLYYILVPVLIVTAISGVGRTIGNYLRRANAIASVKLMNELSTELSTYLPVHEKLASDPTWPSNAEESGARVSLRGYLALFEKIEIAIDNNVLELEAVDRLFAEQFFTLAGHDYVKRQLLGDEYWVRYHLAILDLHEIWFKHRVDAKLPVPNEETQFTNHGAMRNEPESPGVEDSYPDDDSNFVGDEAEK